MTLEQRDRLVAENVMGWQERPCDAQLIEYDGGWECSQCSLDGSWTDFESIWPDHIALPPRYSQDIAAAWQIVEAMTAKMGWQSGGFQWDGPVFKPEDRYLSSSQHIPGRSLTWHFDYTKNGGFRLDEPCWYVKVSLKGHYWWFMADTPQEAICLAALAVNDVEVGP